MTLKADLDNVMAGARANAPTHVVNAIEASIDRLTSAGIGDRAPKPGDTAPNVSLTATDGSTTTLRDLFSDRPLVLIFYRGRWCPFCDLALRAFDAANAEFNAAGAQIVAVSPQSVLETTTTASERGLQFPLYSDAHNAAAHSFGLAWQMNGDDRALAASFKVDLEAVNGNDQWELPAPAAFIIDTSGIVRWAAVDPDYRHRPEPADVLQALRALKLDEPA